MPPDDTHLVPEGEKPESPLVVLRELDAEVLKKCLNVQPVGSPDVDVQKHTQQARHISVSLDAQLADERHERLIGLHSSSINNVDVVGCAGSAEDDRQGCWAIDLVMYLKLLLKKSVCLLPHLSTGGGPPIHHRVHSVGAALGTIRYGDPGKEQQQSRIYQVLL